MHQVSYDHNCKSMFIVLNVASRYVKQFNNDTCQTVVLSHGITKVFDSLLGAWCLCINESSVNDDYGPLRALYIYI